MFGTTGGLRTEREAVRPIHKVMIEINTELGQVHKSLNRKIDIESYIYATEFTQQYISYTSIWNLKFSYNLESPEVAVIQLLHLEYIFNRESSETLQKERTIFNTMQKLFYAYNPYTDNMIALRKQKMIDYIEGKM